MITGMSIKPTRRGLVLLTCYKDKYDPTDDTPEFLQTREKQRVTTPADLVAFTKLGYFTPNAIQVEEP